MSATSLGRRLAELERQVAALRPTAPIRVVALDTGHGDFFVRGSVWEPCADGRALLAEQTGPVKVYWGFDPRLVSGSNGVTPTGASSNDPGAPGMCPEGGSQQ